MYVELVTAKKRQTCPKVASFFIFIYILIKDPPWAVTLSVNTVSTVLCIYDMVVILWDATDIDLYMHVWEGFFHKFNIGRQNSVINRHIEKSQVPAYRKIASAFQKKRKIASILYQHILLQLWLCAVAVWGYLIRLRDLRVRDQDLESEIWAKN